MKKIIIIIITAYVCLNFSYSIIYAQFAECTSMSHVWAVKKNQTGGAHTEVHVMNKNSSYSSYIVNVVTPLEEIFDGKFQFTGGDYQSSFYTQHHPCLWAVKKWGTGSGKTEVHILDPRTNFTTYINQTATVLNQTNNDYYFLAGKRGDYTEPNNICDLWVVKKSHTASGKFEVKILSGESNFQSIILDEILPINIDCKDYWQFALGDYNYDNITDLYMFYIYRDNKIACDDSEDNINTITPIGTDAISNIEVHVRNGLNLQTSLLDAATPLSPTHPSKIQMLVGSMLHGNCIGQYTIQPDVYAVLKNGTGSNQTEVHVLNRLSNYTSFFFQTSTILHQTYDNFEFVTASFWYDSDDQQNVIPSTEKSAETETLNHQSITKSGISNYPNPFNPKTKINYFVKTTSNVAIIIYDSNGKEIKNLVNSIQAPGEYSIEFDGSNYSSGIYFYKAILDGEVYVNKMLLVK